MKPFLFFLLLTPLIAGAQKFPQEFIGNWTGTLHWYQPGKKEPQKAAMLLKIYPSADSAGHYEWDLSYGEGGKDHRPYVLKPVDSLKNRWVVDERNGILLDQYWIGDRFVCHFSVQGTTIHNTYRIEKGRLIAEFYSFALKPVRSSGRGTEESPAVDSQGLRSYQVATLERSGN